MRLFFKHLMRSIAKKPLQPVIMVLTLALAILTTSLCVSVKQLIGEEDSIRHTEKYGHSDFTVTLNGTSKSRFMFADKAAELLEGRAAVAGCYELPLGYGEEKRTVFGVATELESIGEVFDISFSEFERITSSSLSDVALISRELAEECDLELGDTVTLYTLGEPKEYKIAGISENRFMASYDVMVDILGVVRILAKDSAIISALGDSFKPSSTLYFRVNNGYSAEECIAILRTDESLAEKTFTNLSSLDGTISVSESMTVAITISVILAAILSAVITLSSLYILSSERSEENLAFSAAGAKPCLLGALQYLEVAIYWIIGSALALALVVPCTRGLSAYIGFDYAHPQVRLGSFLSCAALILIISFATVTLFILAQRINRHPRLEKSGRRLPPILACAVYVILFAALLALPGRYSVSLYVAIIIATVLLVLIGVPLLMKLTVGAIDAHADKRFEKRFTLKLRELKYAIKNANSVKMLYNTSRLVTIFVIIISTFSLVIYSCHGSFHVSKNIFSAEYAVFNATERCYGKLLECENVDGCYKTYMGSAVMDNRHTSPIFSSTDHAVFSEYTDCEPEISGNGAIISSGQAEMLGLSVGDGFTVTVDGVKLELTVEHIAVTGIAMIVFDAAHFSIPYNMIMVKGRDGVSENEVISEVSDKTATELATITPTSELMKEKIRSASVYLRASDIMLTVVSVFTVTGLANNLYDSYRSRREEFTLYRLSGMSRAEVRRMKLLEVSIMLIFGFALGAFGSVITAIATNYGLHGIGYETLLNFFNSFSI